MKALSPSASLPCNVKYAFSHCFKGTPHLGSRRPKGSGAGSGLWRAVTHAVLGNSVPAAALRDGIPVLIHLPGNVFGQSGRELMFADSGRICPHTALKSLLLHFKTHPMPCVACSIGVHLTPSSSDDIARCLLRRMAAEGTLSHRLDNPFPCNCLPLNAASLSLSRESHSYIPADFFLPLMAFNSRTLIGLVADDMQVL